MSQFSPVEGIVTSISTMQTTVNDRSACTLIFTVQTNDREIVNLVVDPATFVLNQQTLQRGDPIIAFFDNMAPVPLIFPPQYRAVAIVPNHSGQYATMDFFNRSLSNSDDTLRLIRSGSTDIRLQNGQRYLGTLGNQILLVLYSSTTRSLPAQTTPSQIIVFCSPI